MGVESEEPNARGVTLRANCEMLMGVGAPVRGLFPFPACALSLHLAIPPPTLVSVYSP